MLKVYVLPYKNSPQKESFFIPVESGDRGQCTLTRDNQRLDGGTVATASSNFGGFLHDVLWRYAADGETVSFFEVSLRVDPQNGFVSVTIELPQGQAWTPQMEQFVLDAIAQLRNKQVQSQKADPGPDQPSMTAVLSHLGIQPGRQLVHQTPRKGP